MPTKTNYSFALRLESGPSVNIQGEYDTEVYDKINIVIPKSSTKEVVLQPNNDVTNQIEFITIESTKYTTDPEKISYRIGSAGNLILDKAQFLFGKSFIELLPKFNSITFDNKFDEDVTIDIIVGRKAGL